MKCAEVPDPFPSNRFGHLRQVFEDARARKQVEQMIDWQENHAERDRKLAEQKAYLEELIRADRDKQWGQNSRP
jgi:hypothetical protein